MKFILTLFAISTVILVGAFLAAQLQLSPTAELILHFDTAGQPDFTGSLRDVLLMLATGAGLIAINLFLARTLYYRERIASFLIAQATVLITALLFLATFVIISNNR